MEYRKFEKLGIKTSLLGFGCMRFAQQKDGSIRVKRAGQLIDVAYQNGVNYFDTAYNYLNGESEKFTGAALAKYDRSSYYLATKLPFWLINSLEDAKGIFHRQLESLNKDYIDFYLLHAMGRESFDKMAGLGVLEFLDDMKAESKIRYLGFSFHDDYDAFSYILNFRKWDFCQIQLNYMDTDIQAGMKGYALTEKMNVPLIIMEPVKGGSLAKLPDSAARYFKTTAPKQSLSSWALRWVASLPNVKVVLSGMSNQVQLQDNLDTFSNFQPLSETDYQVVDNAVKVLKNRVKNGCTGCSYCMPCPSGVNIPHNFRIWNDYGMYRHPYETRWFWRNDISEQAKAKNCTECGKCEKMCPQKIKIREDLKALQKELDTAIAELK